MTNDHYYFCIVEAFGGNVIYICPAKYFDKNGFCWDGHIQHRLKNLPEGMSEIMECCFSYNTMISDEQMNQIMIDAGFLQNQKFNEFMKRNE